MEEDPTAKPFPRIMVPLVGGLSEFEQQALQIKAAATRVQMERGISIKYEIGTMIEVPRAALVADQIAGLRDPADDSGARLRFGWATGTASVVLPSPFCQAKVATCIDPPSSCSAAR